MLTSLLVTRHWNLTNHLLNHRTSFCRLDRRFNYQRMDPARVQQAIHKGNVLLKFALEIYELQLSEGRNFFYEHPSSTSSWHIPRMMALRRRQGVGETVAHLCQHGLAISEPNGRSFQHRSLPAF